MTTLRPIHPFPARMASDIAFSQYGGLGSDAIILDPMCGSGTTLRSAIESGHDAVGVDADPMAVLVSSVFTQSLDKKKLLQDAADIAREAKELDMSDIKLGWIDQDEETRRFTEFWFAERQLRQLRALSFVLSGIFGPYGDALRLGLSRTIITKEMSASLARDTSHSRPHRVSQTNNYDVYVGFLKGVKIVSERSPDSTIQATAKVSIGDARNLCHIGGSSIDLIVTSPPYLNQIDYMRGHKMALIWFGYTIGSLRPIRSSNIGAERKLQDDNDPVLDQMLERMEFVDQLDLKTRNIFKRYQSDMIKLMSEMHRVLKAQSKATLVVGNSCIKDVFVENTMAVELAALHAGFKLEDSKARDLPANRRYLPPPKEKKDNSMQGRMRTENVMVFKKI